MTKKNKSLTLTVKTVGDDGSIEGYGSVFNVMDSYGDVVQPGAFKKTISDRGNKVRMLWQHFRDQPIGVWDGMAEDSIGLKMNGRINLDTQLGREVYSNLKMGVLDGLSIGYYPVQQDYDSKTGITTVKEVKLMETSIVTFPANESASVTSVKSAFDDLDEEMKLKTLQYINSLRNESLAPATQSPTDEASEGNTVEKDEADKSTNEPLDQELKHSLDRLLKSLKN